MNSASNNGPATWAEANSPLVRHVLGLIRRIAVTLTNGSRWQVLGHTLLDGKPEVHEAENFAGVGIAARPKTPSQCDAMLVFPGAPVPVIIGLRDEPTRAKMAGDLKADETQLHNSQTLIRILADGTVEIRGQLGVAQALATKADLDAVKAAIAGATITPNDGGASFKATILAGLPSSLGLAWPAGTSKLKAQ